MTIRIAMWSTPRNISTAMMRSFEARGDCAVSDEPYYGCFLKDTGLDHPMRAEVIAAMDCTWANVTRALCGAPPADRPIWYQKHMPHHMTGPVSIRDLPDHRHAFLIRDPARILASYASKRERATMADIGIDRQLDYFNQEADRLGHAPPVIDAADVLANPAAVLEALCAALDIAWTPAMLRWPAGKRASDGVWAAHWYDAVERSTGFAAPDARPVTVPPGYEALLEASQPLYEAMKRFALTAPARP